MRVVLFPTCLVDALAPEVGVAAVRVLRRLGCEVAVPEGATCCGQPAWNSGHAAAAAAVARTTLAALADPEAVVVVPAGSCATMIRRFWPELFTIVGDEWSSRRAEEVAGRTRELSEFIDGRPLTFARQDSTPTVYHHSCHMLRELGIREQPESLLAATGAALQPSDGSTRCCGFGGLFSVKLPETSTAMADDVLSAAVATGATRVVGCDASCLLQLGGRARRRGLALDFQHLALVLDAATSPQEAAQR